MIVLFYYNWNGTKEERVQHEANVREHWEQAEGVELVGMYTPSIPFNRVWMVKTETIAAAFSDMPGTPHLGNNNMVMFWEML